MGKSWSAGSTYYPAGLGLASRWSRSSRTPNPSQTAHQTNVMAKHVQVTVRQRLDFWLAVTRLAGCFGDPKCVFLLLAGLTKSVPHTVRPLTDRELADPTTAHGLWF
jgi:hypothetical protein